MNGVLSALVAGAARATFPGVCAWIAARSPRVSARDRHRLALAGLAAHPLVVALALVLPGLHVIPRSDVVKGLGESPRPAVTEYAAQVPIDPLSTAVAPSGSQTSITWSSGRLALIAWMLVFGVLAARLLRSAFAARELLRRSVRGRVLRSGTRSVEVRWSNERSVPFTWGIWTPIVVLPLRAQQWSEERLGAVITHELGHVDRRDVLWHVLGHLVAAVFWFTPLVWALRRAVDDAAEECCDTRVLTSGYSATAYAAELVRLARFRRRYDPLFRVAFTASSGVSALERRVTRILHHPPAVGTGGPAARALAFVALATVATAALRVQVDAEWLANPDVRFPSGCIYRGGRHVNRMVEAGGGLRWEVTWEGAGGCAVTFTADGTVARAMAAGGLDSLALGQSFHVHASGQTETTIDAAVGPEGLSVSALSDGRPVGVMPNGTTAHAWVDRFVDELDAHTAFLALRRTDALLARHGVEGVFDWVERTQGDHAGLRYLRTLVNDAPLTDSQLVRTLRLAARVGDNDAEMVALLQLVNSRYALTGASRDAYADAAGRLRSRAAREAVSAPEVPEHGGRLAAGLRSP